MGIVQVVERSESNEIANENLDNKDRERTDEILQLDASSLVHDSYFTSLMTPTAKEDWGFWGPTAEDIDLEPILSSPWTFPMNRNLNVKAELVLKQKPPEAQWSKPPSLNKEKVEKPLKYEISSTEMAEEGREHKTDSRNRMAGHLVIKDSMGVCPPTFGFSFGTFPNEGPLYPTGMISVDTHLAELPICSDGHRITYQDEMEDMRTRWVTPTENQTLKAVNTNTTNQGRSLACSSSPALESLPNVTQQPNNVLNPLDGSQTTEQTNKAGPLSIQRSLKNITGHSGTETAIITFGLQNGDAEKMTQEAADTHCKMKTSPTEDGSMSIPQPSLCTVQTNVDVETQIKSIMSFSYADILKRSPKTTQQRGTFVKNEKVVGRQNTTQKATTKAAFLNKTGKNRAQVNSKNCGTESSKKITESWKQTEPSTPPFKVKKAQLGFQWPSPRENLKDQSQNKGSWNMAKPQAFTPNNTLNSGSTWRVSKITSNWKAQEHANPDKKDKVYKLYPTERRSKPKLVCSKYLTCLPKEPLKSKPVVSAQPQDTSPQTPEFTLLVKPPETNSTSDVTFEKSNQISTSPALEEPLVIKPDTPQLMPMSDVPVTSAQEHTDTCDLGSSCPPVLQETWECSESEDQIPDQSLMAMENKSANDPTTGLQVPDSNVVVEKNCPKEAPKCQLSGRWKDFYVDNHCTMKCRCRHRPGKLPSNVVRWFSVSQNKPTEPMWITTLKVASSLVAGTRLLLDHQSSQGSEINSTAPNEQPK
ncbi:gametogenetin [Dendrobates tinctorius]|uniref:gametogenetin n=1 Tax=Dendrobates tinctorius TaxID=92724 RepID=UPI003CCA4383